jgi:hypothetical protein
MRGGAAAVALLLGAGAATAQGPPSQTNPMPPTATQPDVHSCAHARLPVRPKAREKAAPGTVGENGQKERLSDKLARSDGVICPPEGVDPEIKAPTPDTGKMPVIPPPGSPGGDPNVRPK